MDFILLIVLGVGYSLADYRDASEVCKAALSQSDPYVVFQRIDNPDNLNENLYIPLTCKAPELIDPPKPEAYLKYDVDAP